ncbi:MAG: hypothetical protein HFH84_11155 [Lachnospiraceae bacterium]|nr:hypothetical protein [Lachnospiraceae bacterium]
MAGGYPFREGQVLAAMDCHAREKENSVCPVWYPACTKVPAGQARKGIRGKDRWNVEWR